jgi:cell wall-associated NlpC family hydrolase
MTRTEIVAAARALLGTPYVWYARVPGKTGGVDCIGVPILVARATGIKPADYDIQGYPQQPDGTMVRLCDEHMGRRVAQKDMLPGDVVIVSWGDAEARHVGIVAPHSAYPGRLSIIHAYPKNKGVTEHRLEFNSFMRFVAAYRFPGIA